MGPPFSSPPRSLSDSGDAAADDGAFDRKVVTRGTRDADERPTLRPQLDHFPRRERIQFEFDDATDFEALVGEQGEFRVFARLPVRVTGHEAIGALRHNRTIPRLDNFARLACQGNKTWSTCGAERTQPVATHGNDERREIGSDATNRNPRQPTATSQTFDGKEQVCHRLPWVADDPLLEREEVDRSLKTENAKSCEPDG